MISGCLFKKEVAGLPYPWNSAALGALLFSWVLLTSGIAYAAAPEYEMDCRFYPKSHSLSVKQSVIFTNTGSNPINEVYFHIYPNRQYSQRDKNFLYIYAGYFKINPFPDGFQCPQFKLKKVYASGGDLAYKIEGPDKTILKVILGTDLKPGESIKLNLDFDLLIPHAYGRLGWHKDITSLGYWYPILSVLDKNGWHNYPYYLYHRPYFSDASLYKVRITLPDNFKLVSTGSKISEKENPDSTKTIDINTELPVRDFTIVLSANFKVHSLEFNGTKINSFYLAQDEFYAKTAAECARDTIANYTKNFGPYPYKEFSIVPVYLGNAGEEFSNLAFIDTRVYKLPKFLIRYFDFLISHETGHQWWYNLVGSDEFKEMFLVEGLNSYTVLMHLEEKYGKDAQVMILPRPFNWFIPNFSFRSSRASRYIWLAKNGLDRPVLGELSSFQEPSSIFALAYGKGSVILDMLSNIIGPDAFNRSLRRYFKEFSFRNSSVEDLLIICQEESGEDLRWFFQEWLNTSKQCDYAVKSIDNKKVILENCGQIQMPVETKIKLKDGQEFIDRWDGKSKIREIALPSDTKLDSVQIDPENSLLEINKANNYYPAKIYSKLVPLYLPIYEIPVLSPFGSYNLVTGPEFSGSGLGVKSSLQRTYDNVFYLSSDYEFNDAKVDSVFGWRINHIFGQQNSLGLEYFDNRDLDGNDNLRGGKLYFRRELWPAAYNLTSVNDHISLYLIRNREFSGSSIKGDLEDITNTHYYKNQEAIVGLALEFARCGPEPDPVSGFRLALNQEVAGHFLGGKQYFLRDKVDFTKYTALLHRQKIATNLSFGWGCPKDKDLFELGGSRGLRGYDLKDIKGSSSMLANIEYRFPLKDDLGIGLFDNIFRLADIQGALFFDAGKAWFGDFHDTPFKKDAGAGLRFHINIGSFLEKMVVRFDCAQAINEPKQSPRFWLGINQAF
ncbi:MAG: M1 family aminopeptidase [Candidatus Omnitrophota bacterium]